MNPGLNKTAWFVLGGLALIIASTLAVRPGSSPIADADVVEAYGGIKAIPTTLIIDRKGRIAEQHTGYRRKSVFEETIKQLLDSPTEQPKRRS